MIIFSFLLLYKYNLNDIAFGVWTGGNVFFSRAVSLAKTWFQFLPQIDLYTDFVPKKGIKTIYDSSSHLNLYIHVTPTFDEFLKYTKYQNKIWDVVQNRHLFTIYDIYRRYPNKKWYFITDDDTFVQPGLIPYFLDFYNYSHNDEMLLGHSYTHLNYLNLYTVTGKNEDFAQGGAGLLFSHSLMKIISGTIMNCSIMKQGASYPSDIRLAHCINEFYFSQNKSKKVNNFIRNSEDWLNGMELKNKNLKKIKGKAQISYHKIMGNLYSLLFNASYSVWTDSHHQERFCDFSFLTGTNINVQFLNKDQIVKFKFGINFQLFSFDSSIMAISQFEPIFAKNDSERIQPIRFTQAYEDGFEMTLLCNDKLDNDEFVFDSFYPIGEKGVNYMIKCPKSQTFLVNSKKAKSVVHPIIYDTYRY